MTEPVKIPVKERYGSCEDPQCFARMSPQCVDRKPIWVFKGLRVCHECMRRAQRAEVA